MAGGALAATCGGLSVATRGYAARSSLLYGPLHVGVISRESCLLLWYTSWMGEQGSRTPAVRASDDERDAVVARLRAAAGEGRLTLDEFADRVDRALVAVARADLKSLTADLPAQSAPSSDEARGWIIGIMGGGDHRGRWRIASRCTVVNLMGGARLDLCDAMLEGSETEIRVFSLMGGSEIIVPSGVHVQLSGFALMGGNGLRLEDAPSPPPGAPVVRVRAYSMMGGTNVRLETTAGPRRPRLHGQPPPAPPPAPTRAG